MAVITVGNTRDFSGWGDARPANTTSVVAVSGSCQAADGTGIINTVVFRLPIAGTVEVAIFRKSGALFTTISTANLGAQTAGTKTVNGLSLAVATGDLIGFYSTVGRVAYAAGWDADYEDTGDFIPCAAQAITFHNAWSVAIRGTGVTSVTPSITSITVDHGDVGDTVTIAGSDFIAAQGTGSVVFTGGGAAAITSWADAQIVCTVPVGTTTGNVTVTNNDGNSDTVNWTLDPYLTARNPVHGTVATAITLTGGSFLAAQGAGGVTINGVAAAITSWAATQIVCTPGALTTSGNIVVTTNDGYTSNTLGWVVDPDVDTATPNSGAVGDSVVLDGSGFEAAQGTGTVTVNGTPATVTAWNDTQITITIPVGATSGDIIVTTDSGYTSPGIPFTVTAAAGGGLAPQVGHGQLSTGAVLCHPPVVG